MRKNSGKTICHTPTPGKQSTAIPTWKYALVHDAILAVVPHTAPGIAAKHLPDLIRQHIASDDLTALGSLAWHATTVRLHMEVTGELRRMPGVRPVHVVRSRSSE